MARISIIAPLALFLCLLTFYFAFRNSHIILTHIKTHTEPPLHPPLNAEPPTTYTTLNPHAPPTSPPSIDTLEDGPSWFIGVSSATHLPGRRQLLRSTWQSMYANTSSFTARFMIGTPAPEWLPVIQQENATYGDIIILDKGADDREFATTIKPFEMLKFLRDHTGGKYWNYVSKIDDDTMLNARQFYEEWIVPEPMRQRAIIGRSIRYARPHDFPAGMFYTLTGDLAVKIANLFEGSEKHLIDIMNEVQHTKRSTGHSLRKRHEDFMMTDILVLNHEEYQLMPIDYSVAFNLADYDKALSEKTIMVHNLKKDEDYMKFAAKFREIEEARQRGERKIIALENVPQNTVTERSEED